MQDRFDIIIRAIGIDDHIINVNPVVDTCKMEAAFKWSAQLDVGEVTMCWLIMAGISNYRTGCIRPDKRSSQST